MPDKVLQMGYMSGDTFTAAVWLKLNATSKIVVVKDTKEPQDKTEKIIMPFYRECGVAEQVTPLDISGTKLQAKDLWKALKESSSDGLDKAAVDPLKAEALKVRAVKPIGWPRAITAVTGWVANAWDADAVGTGKKIAAMWKVVKVEGELFKALDAFVTEKFSGLTAAKQEIRQNIVVLWSRQSGKRGGAHVELDSSFEGIRQLARYFAISEGTATVLLAGDESKGGGKLAALAAENPQIINISNMWEDAAWKEEPLKSSPYLGQFAFFSHTSKLFNIVHVGMRSGILEAMSLMGMKTFYMEPDVCPSGKRMIAFSQANVPYTRIQIKAPAGLTAWNAQVAIEKGIKAPSLDGWKGKVNRSSEYLMGNRKYQSFYEGKEQVKNASGRGTHTETVFYRQAAQADAGIYAKAKVLEEDLLDRNAADFKQKQNAILAGLLIKSPAEVKSGMKANRGFYDEDLEKITTAIGLALKK
jgi:hypothetical protein